MCDQMIIILDNIVKIQIDINFKVKNSNSIN